jgi:hypothetical protein
MLVRPFTALLAAALLGGAGIAVTAAGGKSGGPVADPAAVALLKEAHDNRCAFPADFAGLSADVAINDNGKEVKGTVTYHVGQRVDVKLTDATKEEQMWAREQLATAISHRLNDDFAKGEGANPITFVPDDHSPLGRQVALNDQFKSLDRIKDHRITEVTRTMGDMRFTITVMDNQIVEDGKYLPNQFVVTYFDASSGAIKQMDAYTDGFTKIEGAWVPTTRRIVSAENGAFTTRTYALSNVHLFTKTTVKNAPAALSGATLAAKR